MTTGIERGPRGHFAPGNKGGPGRPKREHEAAYLSIMHRLVTPQTWAAITERAVADALAGDASARAWLAKYLLPEKPDPFADVQAGE